MLHILAHVLKFSNCSLQVCQDKEPQAVVCHQLFK